MLFLTSSIFCFSILIVHVLFICKLVGFVSKFVRIRRVWMRGCVGGFGVRINFVGIFKTVFLGVRCGWIISFRSSCLACLLLP